MTRIKMSRIKGFLFSVFLIVMIMLGGCTSEPKEKVYHIGILSGLDFFAGTIDGFKDKMAELGYIEGKNIVYETQRTNIEPEKERMILQGFISDEVDLILVFPTEASLLAKEIAFESDTPIVFANAFIEGNDLVESVREPGDQITGVRFPGPDVAIKRLEILRQMDPEIKKVWVAYLKGYPSVPPVLDVLRPAAASLGVELIEISATSVTDIKEDLDQRGKSEDIGVDAILTIPEPLTVSLQALAIISSFAVDHKVPIAAAMISQKGEGMVFGYVSDAYEVGTLAAPAADKILKGTPAGKIPIVSPPNHLHINYKVAKEFGLNVSPGLLSLADTIIK